jgi:hypothetical protein
LLVSWKWCYVPWREWWIGSCCCRSSWEWWRIHVFRWISHGISTRFSFRSIRGKFFTILNIFLFTK